MSELKLNFSDYKASGVYFIEVDNSIINTRTYNAASRLAVGFSTKGPFNRPVFLSGAADVSEFFGNIDRRMERNGCFTNRNIRTMVAKSPIFAINLMPIDTREDLATNSDTVGFSMLSMEANKDNYCADTLYAYMYDRSRFWVADETAFERNVFFDAGLAEAKEKGYTHPTSEAEVSMFGIGNCSTKDISVIVRKAENVSGYNVTFLEWFGNEESIPYKWVNPMDYVSDYFVQVIAIAGKWDASTYAAYSTDAVWSSFFTKDGLIASKLNKFLRLDAVEVLGNWTGCIIPNFLDKQGHDRSIDYLINKSCNSTGLLWGMNSSAMDSLCLGNKSEDGNGVITEGDYKYFIDNDGDGICGVGDLDSPTHIVDLVGHSLAMQDSSAINVSNFLSYVFSQERVEQSIFDVSANTYYIDNDPSVGRVDLKPTQFAIASNPDDENPININVGDFVMTANKLLTRINKKRCFKQDVGGNASYVTVYTALNTVWTGTYDDVGITVFKNFTEMYDTLKFIPLSGLKLRNKHMPGYDKQGKYNPEEGVEKIYAMLEDPGIRKGLLNNDMIDFRYIVDTMAYGLGAECGAKRHLCKLASDKGHCTALCNIPSMSQFADSDAPFFGDAYTKGEQPAPAFNVKYIAEGGNQDMVYDSAGVESFTLPLEENGAKTCGFFAPFFKYAEGSRTVLVPPAADVSNTFVGRFTAGDPYATVANYNGIITNGQITDVEYLFDATDRGYLEPFGVNPIINREGNIMIYGDRTAYQTVNSDLSFLHVRELVNTIEINCKNVLDKYVFTYNIPTVRAEIVSRINPILSAMKDCGALVKYEIQCDANNNTAEVINNKFCIVDIGIWVSQNMEKIVTRITLNRSTTADVEQ